MDKKTAISRSQNRVRRKVGQLVDGKVTGASQLRPLFDEIKHQEMEAYFFGGMLRNFSLYSQFIAPRDIDIVVASGLEGLADRFSKNLVRRNSFGGLKLEFGKHQIDIWQLDRTWGFTQGLISPARIEHLPKTTFLNVDALAIEIHPVKGSGRKIYEYGFFDSLLSKTIEINLHENPYPELCVVRAVMIALSTGFALGPKLVDYIVRYLHDLEPELFEIVQRKHYGRVKKSAEELLVMRAALSNEATVSRRFAANLLGHEVLFFDYDKTTQTQAPAIVPVLAAYNDRVGEIEAFEHWDRFMSHLLLDETSCF